MISKKTLIFLFMALVVATTTAILIVEAFEPGTTLLKTILLIALSMCNFVISIPLLQKYSKDVSTLK